jgi:hypothetical protein
LNDRSDNENLKENVEISSSETPFEQMLSYNMSEAERPGGLKVRFKIRIVSGKQAALLDERQAGAIRGLLEWTMRYRQQGEGSR